MPRPKRKSQYTRKQNRTIFLLKNPLTNEFYVGHTLAHNMRSTYKDHYIETKYKTAAMVQNLKALGHKPCCFELETINCTAVRAYRHVIVWTKIFLEHGFVNLDNGSVIDYAKDLLEENKALYNELKQKNMNEMISCKICLFPTYGRKKCLLMKGVEDTNGRQTDHSS